MKSGNQPFAGQEMPAGEKPDGGCNRRVPRGLCKAKASPLRRASRGSRKAFAFLRTWRALPFILPEPVSIHAQCRIRPSPRSFGLFAAEGFDQDRQAWRIGQG